MRFTIVLSLACLWSYTNAQPKKFVRIFQASLTPGVSTNGFHPGSYKNFFSFNLTSGYSSANYLVEIGLISNLNERETRGLQVAGIANVTGANAFASMQVKEIEKKKREGFEANLSGLQIAGLTNVVLNNTFGSQIVGGVNISKGALQGLQISGLANIVEKYSFGVQVAGIYNVSIESIDGIQAAGIFNFTSGGLFGAQISLYNKAGFMDGINSFGNQGPTGIQIGLLNQAKSMNGFQIGLINISVAMQGTQVGLINIYRNGKTPETRDGTSIGLINIGSSGYFSAYANEIFYANIEVATGTLKNRRMNTDLKEKQIQNALIYSRGSYSNDERWALGYGLKKYFFNKSMSPGYGHLRFVSCGIDLLHVNHESKKFTEELSLLTRPTISAGSRFHPKNRILFLFAAVSYNMYKSASRKQIDTVLNESEEKQNSGIQQWPGFSLGIFIQ